MASIDSITLEVGDPTAAQAFYSTAFGLGPELQVRAAEAPTSGFRGFTLSLSRVCVGRHTNGWPGGKLVRP